MRVDILGVWFDNVDMSGAVEKAVSIIEGGQRGYVVTPNSEIVYEAQRDENLRGILNNASLVLPDGAGIVLASKILKRPLRQKVAGVEFADALIYYAARKGKSLYLLGGRPEVSSAAVTRLNERYDDLNIAGYSDGYYKDEDKLIGEINAASPDILFVCLGCPKQELWMARNFSRLNVGLMAGLGGTIDIIAGTTKRGPEWMYKHNLEWLYRLIKQPSRIGRMMRLPKFLLRVIAYRLSGKGRRLESIEAVDVSAGAGSDDSSL